jgi:hypothetical protein
LCRITDTDKIKASKFPYGLEIWNVPLEYALNLVGNEPALITYCFWKKYAVHAEPLIRAGVPMVVHDPAEFHSDELELFKRLRYRPIVIRDRNVRGLKALGVESTYIPHPYATSPTVPMPKVYRALCLARVDFRKRTHWIVTANKALSESKQCHLYGEVNRIYEYHQLRKEHPDWKQWYHGQFPDRLGAAVELFGGAEYAVDLTHIQGDGGGTQYTFFEAWNAGIPLVLNRAWETGVTDEVRDGDSCVMVNNADELVEVLNTNPKNFAGIVEGGTRIMHAHGNDVAMLYAEQAIRRP